MVTAKVNKLSSGQMVLLHGWLMANKDVIMGSGFTHNQIADRASETLKFNVVASNIITLRNELNIEWLNSGRCTNQHPRNYAVLAKCLASLYEKCGEAVPPELLRLCPS